LGKRGRPPREDEPRIGLSALDGARRAKLPDGSAPSAELPWEQYCQVLLCANEFVYLD